ncbi:MAG: DUF58 domain-containing protein [Saprospiraceae bacterium]|nr:MAG: hypothetical protein UZ09_BCD002001814 [Bacteroidetes bacterium OLB9]MCO6463759.1 DUF58 domain-containing protein [Saprospiraceae bacterium]MCZ2338601.1 DUF58 domain-containing protein [Chitinophagales bacterium]
MDTADIIKKVRKLEIKTKGLSKHIFSGEYHSAFKGRGMSFSEVREYIYGDDIRNIDWNVTARTGGPHIKVFEEERELTVMLLVDISASSFFGTRTALKSEVMTEIAAVLAFSAITNNDKVGAILFSDHVVKYLPPKKGVQNILRIIRELVHIDAVPAKTNLSEALVYLHNIEKKRSIAFVLSDFLTSDYEQALSIAGKKHDIIGVKVTDVAEHTLPDVGLIRAVDAETGAERIIDTSDRAVRQHWKAYFSRMEEDFRQSFIRQKCDTIAVTSGEDYVKALQIFFKQRSKR